MLDPFLWLQCNKVEIHKINSPSTLHYTQKFGKSLLNNSCGKEEINRVEMWMLVKVMLVKNWGQLKHYLNKYTVLNVLLLAKVVQT